MDVIRQRISYKDVPVHICFKTLSRREQYECIRLILANRSDGVTVCTHGNSNSYLDTLISELPPAGFQQICSCSGEQVGL
jgi:hypothetical protein